MQRALEAEGFEVLAARDGAEGWELFRRRRVDVVVSDVEMPGGGGLPLLRRIRSRQSPHPRVPVLMVSGVWTPERAGRAGQLGGTNFFSLDEAGIAQVVERVKRLVGAGEIVIPAELVGGGAAICRARERLERIAALEGPVLLHGPPGSGRGAAARFLHQHGLTPAEPMATVRCGESRERPTRGVWTYLANVDRLDPEAQAMWRDELRRQESGEASVARVVASTSVDLVAAAADGRFDLELGRRLSLVVIRLTALSDRTEDLEDLCQALVERIEQRIGRHGVTLGASALRRLGAAPWERGIPQLEEFLYALVCESEPGRVGLAAVEALLTEREAANREELERRERERLASLLAEKRTIPAVAEALGLSPSGARYRLEKHGLLPGMRRCSPPQGADKKARK